MNFKFYIIYFELIRSILFDVHFHYVDRYGKVSKTNLKNVEKVINMVKKSNNGEKFRKW